MTLWKQASGKGRLAASPEGMALAAGLGSRLVLVEQRRDPGRRT